MFSHLPELKLADNRGNHCTDVAMPSVFTTTIRDITTLRNQMPNVDYFNGDCVIARTTLQPRALPPASADRRFVGSGIRRLRLLSPVLVPESWGFIEVFEIGDFNGCPGRDGLTRLSWRQLAAAILALCSH